MSDREKIEWRQGVSKYEGECKHQDFWVIRCNENPTTINTKITREKSYTNRFFTVALYTHNCSVLLHTILHTNAA